MGDQRPTLFVDTCAILDLVRLPYRSGDLERELRAATELQTMASEHKIHLVAARITKTEYDRNEDNVVRDLEIFVKRAAADAHRLASYSDYVGAGAVSWTIDHGLFVERAKQAGRSALAACEMLEASDDDYLRASKRQAQALRPASSS